MTVFTTATSSAPLRRAPLAAAVVLALAAVNGVGAATLDTSDMPLLRNEGGAPAKPAMRRAAAPARRAITPVQQDLDGAMPEVELFQGESRVFPAPGVARIAVGSARVMTANALDDREVIVFGNTVGASTLFIWNKEGRLQRIRINVVPGDTGRVAREVADFLTRIPNAHASVVADKVIVEGDELTDNDREKVAELAKRYPQIVNFTNPIGWEPMIMMDVKVVEFPKSELRELGLKWNPAGGAAGGAIWYPGGRGDTGGRQINITGGNGAPPITAIGGTGPVTLPGPLTIMSALNAGLNAQLNLLDQNGRATILAEPQLSTRSGYKASFLAGGEFPYSVSNLNGVTIQFKQYGIKLDIEPKIGRNGVIRAVIESEVSSLDGSVSSTAGPALLTRRTKTEFNVRTGETIVLSGLLQRTSSTDIDKVPLLGDIPVLGALFRSKRFQNKETELVVFVTPTSVDTRSPGMVDRIERTTERLTEQLGRTPYLSNPLQPGRDAAHPERGGAAVPAAASAPAAPPAAPAQPPSAVRGSPLRVKRNGVIVRAEPNNASQPIADLSYNEVVRLGEAELRAGSGGNWRNVQTAGTSGWVLASDVEPIHLSAAERAAH